MSQNINQHERKTSQIYQRTKSTPSSFHTSPAVTAAAPKSQKGSLSQLCSEQRVLGYVKLCSDRLSATLYTNFLHFTVFLTELKTIKYPDFYTSVWKMKIDAGSYMSR